MLVVRNDGDAKGVIAKNTKVVEAVYEVPLLAHATMEPCNATIPPGGGPSRHLDGIAKAPRQRQKWRPSWRAWAPEQVYFHQAYLGGGFGRRSNGDELRQAIQVAKAGQIDKPLQLLWSREQDMAADRYPPAIGGAAEGRAQRRWQAGSAAH